MRKLILSIVLVISSLVAVQLVRRNNLPEAPEKAGRRLVSLAPNLTSLLFGLGLGAQVVGVTTYCDDPPEALTREKVGNFLSPNLEKILDLNPDSVLAETWSSSRTVPRLRQLGLEVLEVPTPQSLAGIRQMIRELGEVLDNTAGANALIQSMDARLVEIREQAATYRWRPKVYLEIDIPSWTVGSASFTNEALEIAGFQNLFGDLAQPAPRVSSEAVIERNPDIIVSFAATAAQIAARPGWQAISAVQRNWIIDDFPEAMLSRGNHQVADGMRGFQERVDKLPGWTSKTP